jgi:uncharacterized circularly permuted ATP-grasp superfamily protein
VHLFRSQQRETLLQVKTHLVAKYTKGAGTGTVSFTGTIGQNMVEQVVVLLHEKRLNWIGEGTKSKGFAVQLAGY